MQKVKQHNKSDRSKQVNKSRATLVPHRNLILFNLPTFSSAYTVHTYSITAYNLQNYEYVQFFETNKF